MKIIEILGIGTSARNDLSLTVRLVPDYFDRSIRSET